MKKIQDNRNMKLINSCKQMFEEINMHQNIIGGFVQARVISSHSNDSQVFYALKNNSLAYRYLILDITCLTFDNLFTPYLQLEHVWIPIFAYPEMLSSSLIDCLAMGVQQNYKPSSLENIHAQHTSCSGNSNANERTGSKTVYNNC